MLQDTTEKNCLLIDIALPVDTNFNRKGTEEISKYKYSVIAVSRMWKVRTNFVPVTIGALGTTTKSEPSDSPRSPVGYRDT
jgi:hypothetical protein